jgi:hypothetical protein
MNSGECWLSALAISHRSRNPPSDDGVFGDVFLDLSAPEDFALFVKIFRAHIHGCGREAGCCGSE